MEKFTPPCKECGGKCCDYVAIEIDRPRKKADYDHIRWYLAHEKVHVFVDHEKKWYVQFLSTCRHKNKSNKCDIYEERPSICSEHGNSEGECEFYSSPYSEYFINDSDFEDYLREKGKDWKYKGRS